MRLQLELEVAQLLLGERALELCGVHLAVAEVHPHADSRGDRQHEGVDDDVVRKLHEVTNRQATIVIGAEPDEGRQDVASHQVQRRVQHREQQKTEDMESGTARRQLWLVIGPAILEEYDADHEHDSAACAGAFFEHPDQQCVGSPSRQIIEVEIQKVQRSHDHDQQADPDPEVRPRTSRTAAEPRDRTRRVQGSLSVDLQGGTACGWLLLVDERSDGQSQRRVSWFYGLVPSTRLKPQAAPSAHPVLRLVGHAMKARAGRGRTRRPSWPFGAFPTADPRIPVLLP